MFNKNPNAVIWYDGEFVAWDQATTHVLSHSLHYGMGVFEGIRAYDLPRGSNIFRFEDHIDRFYNSAKILGMKLPFDAHVLNEASKQCLQRNDLKAAYIRPLAFYGSESMRVSAHDVKVHMVVAVWPWDAYLGEENLSRGIKVMTSSYNKHHVNASMTKAKATGNYINSTLALHEALAAGCDEALLLDTSGYVSEGTGENIFMVKKGKIYTPDLTSCLEGITRDCVITLAKDQNLEVIEAPITRDALYVADELFFTGTAAEVTPIRELDGREIGDGSRGPVTEKIQTIFFDQVTGRANDYPEWFSAVK